MERINIIRVLFLTGVIFMIAISCKYDEVLPFEPDPGADIFFNQDILPIFNTSCNGSGCHNGQGPSPDLSSGVAYDALWTGGYINIEIPAQSELYLWMTEVKGPMPPLGANATNNALVLQWITQGALNN